MKIHIRFRWTAVLLLISMSLTIFAGDKFKWEEVAESDWQVTEDSTLGIQDAIMLFEKVEADNQKMGDSKSYLDIYRRIKVFNLEGRAWGDVAIPYLDDEQKIKELQARTLLPDGNVITLQDDDVVEKEIFKTKGIRFKQKSFSMPGMVDGSIIEYRFKLEIPFHEGVWDIQKEIYLKRGEYRWILFDGRGLAGLILGILGLNTPNYAWLNVQDMDTDVKLIPEEGTTEEVLFTVANVKPFEPEPFMPVALSLKCQLRTYYSGGSDAEDYWHKIGKNRFDNVREFTKERSDVTTLAQDEFASLPDKDAQLEAAYHWVQNNIRNLSYEQESDESVENRANINDVLTLRYGTSYQITLLYYAILDELGLNPTLAYAVDRDDNYFTVQAKYWQFDRIMITLDGYGGSSRYFVPGMKYLPYGDIPWYNEGAQALVIRGGIRAQIVTLPESASKGNRIRRLQNLAFDESMRINGILNERHYGQHARIIRLRLDGKTSAEQEEIIIEELSNLYAGNKADSIKIGGLDNPEAPFSMDCSISVGGTAQELGNRLLVKPYDFFSENEVPFIATDRKHPIEFDFAKEVIESINLQIPHGYELEELPSDTAYTNSVGECQITFRHYNNSISVQRRFELKKPIWPQRYYPLIRNLFQAQSAFAESIVVLKREES